MSILEGAAVALWEIDLADLRGALAGFEGRGVDPASHLSEHASEAAALVGRMRILEVNRPALSLHEAPGREELQAQLGLIFSRAATPLLDALRGLPASVELETSLGTLTGGVVPVRLTWTALEGSRVLLTEVDLGDLRRLESELRLAEERIRLLRAGLGEKSPLDERLEESERRFRTMADSAPVMLWMAGRDGLCDFFNQVWLDFTGRSRDEEIGNGWAEGVHPEDFELCMHTYLESFVARSPFRMEYRLRRADGQYRWILDTGVPRLSEQGRFAGYIGSCIDITDMKEVHAQLDGRVKKRTEELDAAVHELEAFCYCVSHDLRAPLRGIDGFSHALLDEHAHQLDAEGHDYLRRVRAAAQRMGVMIDELLGLSRLSRSELRLQPVDLSECARAVVEELRHSQPERAVDVEVKDGVMARGDPVLLRVVLENLLGNAWKFTGKTVEPRIRFGSLEKEGRTVYFVADNGAGFDVAGARALFAPFQRLHTVAEFPGTGVGLASVQRIIHRHSGRIWPDATEGHGATFYWTLG
jgi:PAS domain S-box-containing protein